MIGISLGPASRRYDFYRWAHTRWAIVRDIVRLMLPSGSATVILMAGFMLFMRFVGELDAEVGGNTYSAATKALMDTPPRCASCR